MPDCKNLYIYIFTSSISDKWLTSDSGFYHKPGDAVMADKG